MSRNSISTILQNYNNENAGVKAKLYQILMHGKLAGSGRLLILPVDQGFEHGPDRSFSINSPAYDPDYHFQLAIAGRFSAYAAPFGFLAASIDKFAGQIPVILKLNSNNSLTAKSQVPDMAITASVKDALRLGAAAVGFTIYPGSPKAKDMMEEAREIVQEAKSCGLATVIWSYPRGGDLSKEGETAIDICAYGAHIAALLGADIIKVKLPTSHIEQAKNKECYKSAQIHIDLLTDRVRHIVKSCFNGKRIVVFSGGEAKSEEELLEEVNAIKRGGGHGSIIGRNVFQRRWEDSLDLIEKIAYLYSAPC